MVDRGVDRLLKRAVGGVEASLPAHDLNVGEAVQLAVQPLGDSIGAGALGRDVRWRGNEEAQPSHLRALLGYVI
jgi:hypothetical protein